MAPKEQRMKTNKFKTNYGSLKNSKNTPHGVQKKRKWIQEHKVFEGSLKEGQGFAFKRKQKVHHEYNKLLRKEKKQPELKRLYKEEYPEHLRHLYEAEAQKERKEDWEKQVNRRKQRLKDQVKETTGGDDDADDDDAQQAETAEGGGTEKPEQTEASTARESLPMSNRMRKRLQKKTSYQKTKEEFEQVREKRKKRKEEYLKNKQQRDEAIQRYTQKKKETFQMLSKKTKKGQPNLNLQMEYLLQKIQKS
ncbi:thyroid transcription factor 1-associated protein 26 homolog [Gouania willdenowi]|uniref:Thyroid transcription factor 1-associated protein 26 n=1 Tax=Gouania willdenowi TaxID=441366 RepID=A0A8C5E497_GOUWI|nr:thyroid transcription factor 1-associated protein 26 [Gouania willdenowi]